MYAALLGTCALGLGLGLRHALESDHVAAIGTMVADGQGPRRAALLGASWGAGHAVAVLGAGLVLVALRVTVPAPIAVALDAAVAVMLAALGARAVLRSRDAGLGHAHAPPRSPRAALLIGLVHGASGTAALTLLVLSTLPDRTSGAAFLAVFTLGATAGMTALSALLALPLGAAMHRWQPAARTVQLAAGALSFAAAAMVAVGVVTSAAPH